MRLVCLGWVWRAKMPIWLRYCPHHTAASLYLSHSLSLSLFLFLFLCCCCCRVLKCEVLRKRQAPVKIWFLLPFRVLPLWRSSSFLPRLPFSLPHSPSLFCVSIKLTPWAVKLSWFLMQSRWACIRARAAYFLAGIRNWGICRDCRIKTEPKTEL